MSVGYRLIFLVAFGSFFALSAYSATEIDLSWCDRLLKPAELGTQISDLPSTIAFSVNKETALTYFQLANDNFRQVLSSEKLSDSLGQIDDPTAQSSLKRVRKYGQLIRSAFQVLSQDHNIPPSLDRFVVDLGHLNDYIEGNIQKSIPKQVEAVTKDLAVIDGKNWLEKFVPAKKSSIRDFIDEQLDTIKDDLKNKKFKAKEFHEIRVMLKSLMNLYFFRAAFDSSQETQNIYKFLLELNQEMGEVHDDLVLRDNRGEIDYDSYKLKIPEPIRKKILALLNRFQ